MVYRVMYIHSIYIGIFIHTYMHTCTHACMHTYIHIPNTEMYITVDWERKHEEAVKAKPTGRAGHDERSSTQVLVCVCVDARCVCVCVYAVYI